MPALWLLGATLELQSSSGVRQLALSDLYKEDGIERLSIAPGEVLTAITLPKPTGTTVHRKLRLRGAIDYPALLVAVRREGQAAEAVISAIGPKPIAISANSADALIEQAWAQAKPLNTHAISTAWRRQMVKVEISRALADAQT